MRSFQTFQDAFDYCREKGCPVYVFVEGKRYKLYPSGKAHPRPWALANWRDTTKALRHQES